MTNLIGKAPQRMCSLCRGPIAAGANSLTLNGVFAHVECVETALREPAPAFTDEQLRAECARRDIQTAIAGEAYVTVDSHYVTVDSHNALRAERDEWKREHELLNAEYRTWRERMWKTLRELGCAEGVDPESFLLDLKRRAETAEERNSHLEARIESGHLPTIAKLQRMACGPPESGPGITTLDTRPDNSITHLDEDLLCEDA